MTLRALLLEATALFATAVSEHERIGEIIAGSLP